MEEYQCVMCPEGKCSADCPTLDVLPYKEPVAEENIKKARKLVALGMDTKYIKNTLKIAGELDDKNKLIDMWLLEYDSKPKEKDPLLVLIENRNMLAQKQKIIEEKKKMLAQSQNTLESLKAQAKILSDELDSDPASDVEKKKALESLKAQLKN